MGEHTRVIPHYPVDKLPPDLRAGLEAGELVTITVVREPPAPTLKSVMELFGKSGRAHEDPVADIRKLRDEWDD